MSRYKILYEDLCRDVEKERKAQRKAEDALCVAMRVNTVLLDHIAETSGTETVIKLIRKVVDAESEVTPLKPV